MDFWVVIYFFVVVVVVVNFFFIYLFQLSFILCLLKEENSQRIWKCANERMYTKKKICFVLCLQVFEVEAEMLGDRVVVREGGAKSPLRVTMSDLAIIYLYQKYTTSFSFLLFSFPLLLSVG